MRLGYACINTSLPTNFKTCRLATFEKKGPEVIKELTLNNLENVLKALQWNIKNNIYFYRISTEVVPLGSHQKMTWDWWRDLDILHLTSKIKKFKEDNDIRLSMHPGQFTVLSTPREDVLERSFKDLEYHDQVLCLVGGTDMIIHGGGKYGEIDLAKERFISSYNKLSPTIKEKLRLENDDKTYHLQDVLDIYNSCNIPICYDIHHHRCYNDGSPLKPMLQNVFTSWSNVGKPKVHISSGKTHEKDRSHHEYVFKNDFQRLLVQLDGRDVDIMLEAKRKELAVLRIHEEIFPSKK